MEGVVVDGQQHEVEDWKMFFVHKRLGLWR